MNNNFYNLNIGRLLLWLLPQMYRTTALFKWVVCMAIPVQRLHLNFMAFRVSTLYYLGITPQVCYLEKLINDKCDAAARRLFITDVQAVPALYLWPDAAARDVNFTADVYVWPDARYANGGVDFTVHIPFAIINTAAEITYLKSLLNAHKLPGLHYNLVKY
jgi:hypothetical protein